MQLSSMKLSAKEQGHSTVPSLRVNPNEPVNHLYKKNASEEKLNVLEALEILQSLHEI